jgi:putative chitinase
MRLTKEVILKIAPRANLALVNEIVTTLPKLAPQYGLGSDDEILQFLAQCIHESNGLTTFKENLNYSSAARIAAVWPSRFTTKSAIPYARNPAKLASKVYANRMGNGDEESGDGWKYSGKGLLQATGKAMFKMISDITGYDFVSKPDDMVLPKYNLLSALAVAKILKLGEIHDFKSDTKKLNGGYTNYEDRLSLYNRLKTLT